MNENRKRKHAMSNPPSCDDVNEMIKSRQVTRHSSEGQDVTHHHREYNINEKDEHSLLVDFRVINDPVHGHFEISKILFNIIDTPQFQRLREIKQLGSCYLVFPGACHNRFEHSIGVAYLAGKMCSTLQRRQPQLNITRKDCICVQIAGLCHDLGHGPLSHFFDGLFIPRVHPDRKWRHEDASVKMFDYMVEKNNLMDVFTAVGLDESDILFIKELIAGPLTISELPDEWTYKGRPKSKSYLYEIVANKRTGIDVDKWDYFARDCYHLGISNNFDYKRFMKFARVVLVDGKYQICTRDKEVSTLYDMFHTRNSLHRRAYQHKTVKIIDTMLLDVLLLANEYITLPGSNGKKCKVSDSIDDMEAYCHLTDTIFKLIEISTGDELLQAKKLLHRVTTRDLYKMVGQTILKDRVNKTESEKLCSQILRSGSEDSLLDTKDFAVHIIEYDYGMKTNNPIDQVHFYHKKNPSVALHLSKSQVSQMLPTTFIEQHLRLYYKEKDQNSFDKASRAFADWCKKTKSSNP